MPLLYHQLELLAPTRDADIGIEAVNHGADPVYIGGPSFGARSRPGNNMADIAQLVRYAHSFSSRIFIKSSDTEQKSHCGSLLASTYLDRKQKMKTFFYPPLGTPFGPFDLMQMSVKGALSVFAALLLAAAPGPASAQDDSWKAAMGDASELAPDLREEIVSIPQWNATSTDKAAPLVGTLYQPMGVGPFPVVVLSHGSPGRAADRKVMGRYRVIPQVKALLGMGFSVLVPMRRGYGVSPSDYAESFGYCQEPRYEKTGEESSRDLRSAVAYIRTRPSLDSTKIVLMGQSAGGFASIATGSLALDGVVAVANFSGGRGGNGIDGVPCRPDLMAQVIATYAKTLRVPVLWFYVENDKYFGPATAKTWFAAFESAGGKGKLVLHPPYGSDGHLLFYTAAAVPIWTEALNSFFRDAGLTSLTRTP